jgi:predicted Zn finger-like uncharacterized protein
MTTIIVRCPKCKTQYKIKNAEEMEGKKVVCKKCSEPIRIRLPSAVPPKQSDAAQSDEEEFGGDEPFEDEFPASKLPARAPLPMKRPKKKGDPNKSSETAAQGKKGEGKAAKNSGSNNTLVIVIALVLGALALGGIGVGGMLLMRGGASARYEAPVEKEYADFRPKDSGLSYRIPKWWTQEWGGGMGGQPYWVRFGDDHLKIEARESVGGGAMAQAAIAMQQKLDPGGQDEALSPAAKVHEAQMHDFAENFQDYHEEPARKIKTKYGEGRISDFTAKEGIFKSKVNGSRATLLSNIHQFNVTFKCSPAMFKDAKPVFEKVVSSLGPGSGP